VSQTWTPAGEHLPWLRGQGFHIAAAGTERVVSPALTAAGFTIARAQTANVAKTARYRAVVDALQLPDSATNNLDALVDSLRDLPEVWPNTERLALLWSGADALARTSLLSFTEVAGALKSATVDLWSVGMVFESVFFVDPEAYGADQPLT
jgi:hypothetical protein